MNDKLTVRWHQAVLPNGLPVRFADSVFHWGTLKPADRGQQFSQSLEGGCLSVSRTPEAWRSIAKLGGAPLMAMSRKDGEPGAFLDMHSLLNDAGFCETVSLWGEELGLVELATRWRAWWLDSETDKWGYLLTESEEEAEREASDEAPAGHAPVEPIETAIATSRLAEHFHSRLEGEPAIDELMQFWAETEIPDEAIDGLWWDETYDPASLSAPRGGIFPQRLSEWRAVEQSSTPDDDALLRSDATQRVHWLPVSQLVQGPLRVRAYHGGAPFEQFDFAFVGHGNDEDGPGLYCTDDFDEAQFYGAQKDDGVVHTFELAFRYPVPLNGEVNRHHVRELMLKAADVDSLDELRRWGDDLDHSPFWDSYLCDWNEDPVAAFHAAETALIGDDESPYLVFLRIWGDGFRWDGPRFVQAMVDLGYDGVALPAGWKGNMHPRFLVWDPEAITMHCIEPVSTPRTGPKLGP